jgi:Putative prokaryotic signal transducing protein
LSGFRVYRELLTLPVPFFNWRFFTRSNLLVSLALNKGLAQGRYTERMSQSDLVVVQSYGTEGEAEVAKGVLESSGIDAMIQADTAGRMREHLAWSGLGHRVLVREEDAAAARSLLALPQNDELVLLQKYAAETQVDILQGALLSAGIFATVRDDGTYYQLFVNKEDAATARKVLETLSEARP